MATIKQNVSIVNYEMRRGDTFNPTLTYRDAAGLPFDLTSHTAKLEIRDSIDGTILQTLTNLSGITLTNTSPNISILIADSATALYTFKVAVYDLELTDASGVVKTLMEGSIILKLDVTK